MGGMNYTRKSIMISNNMSKEDMYITYLHEVCHVGMYVAGLNQVIPLEMQEILCETLANTFFDVNKKWVTLFLFPLTIALIEMKSLD